MLAQRERENKSKEPFLRINARVMGMFLCYAGYA